MADPTVAANVCQNPSCPDLERYGIHGEYGPGIDRCPKCNTPLTPAPAPPAPSPAAEDVIAKLAGHRPPEPGDLRPLCAPLTSPELAIIRSLLEAEGIFCFVHNEHFGALNVGPWIPLLNVRTVCVPATDLERARELLIPAVPLQLERSKHSLEDKLRNVMEALLFGWVIPGRRPPISHRPEDCQS